MSHVRAAERPPKKTKKNKQRNQTQKWTRRLHMWTSMVSLLIVLFFALTGITLNHPTWTFGQPVVSEQITGTLPESTDAATGVDLIAVSELMRSQYGVTGPISDYTNTNESASLSYRSPGYSADVQITPSSGNFSLTTQRSGLVGVLNDLHKGRNTGSVWKAVIDISGLLLVAISITGIVLQATIARRRKTAFIIAGVGSLLSLVLIIASF